MVSLCFRPNLWWWKLQQKPNSCCVIGLLWPAIVSGKDCSEDVDECSDPNNECVENSSCDNTFGSYNCTCNNGYRGKGREKCYEIILFPYGLDQNDELLWPVSDGVASPTIRYVNDIAVLSKHTPVSICFIKKRCDWKEEYWQTKPKSQLRSI